MENHFILLNTKWISNNFLFSIAGGAFASLVIVLVCEIIKYHQHKQIAENILLINLENLYGQFLIIRGNCKRALNSLDNIADNLIQPTCENARVIINHINGIDYLPFCSNSKIKELLDQFNTDKQLAIKSVLSSFIFLSIAICEDKMVLLQKKMPEIVSSGCPNTNKALHKVIAQTSTILNYLDQIISQIDKELRNRHHWQILKQTLNTYQDNFISQKLNDYLKEDVTGF